MALGGLWPTSSCESSVSAASYTDRKTLKNQMLPVSETAKHKALLNVFMCAAITLEDESDFRTEWINRKKGNDHIQLNFRCSIRFCRFNLNLIQSVFAVGRAAGNSN